jgi:hypothetical protein
MHTCLTSIEKMAEIYEYFLCFLCFPVSLFFFTLFLLSYSTVHIISLPALIIHLVNILAFLPPYTIVSSVMTCAFFFSLRQRAIAETGLPMFRRFPAILNSRIFYTRHWRIFNRVLTRISSPSCSFSTY